jgi:hypothetical protein
MASRYRAELETALHRAWMQVQKAREAAILMDNYGADQDLFAIGEELRRLMEDSTNGRRRAAR